MESMTVISFLLFLGMIQLRWVILIFTALLIITTTVTAGSAHYLSVKSYSYLMEVSFFVALHTLKYH
jgi:hypothetical protein